MGPITQGITVPVTWSLLNGVDVVEIVESTTGKLSAQDSATKNVIVIDPAVPLSTKSYLWTVKVPPGIYILGLNNGSGLKQSGKIVIWPQEQ